MERAAQGCFSPTDSPNGAITATTLTTKDGKVIGGYVDTVQHHPRAHPDALSHLGVHENEELAKRCVNLKRN